MGLELILLSVLLYMSPVAKLQICNKLKKSIYWYFFFSSQEDGGGPTTSKSHSPQDFVEQTASLDGADGFSGDVSRYQHFHILLWVQQA